MSTTIDGRERLTTSCHRATVWTLSAERRRDDPWGEIAVTALMTEPDGSVRRVPAFWDGGQTWRVRLTATSPGTLRISSECTDPSDSGLHGKRAVLEVAPADAHETNPLYRHGAVRVSPPGGSFEHADGTPFSWLGDTWWMLMSERVSWPEGFARLTAGRAAQGFTVVQIVVGFAPDTTPFDGRDANAGGSPWMPGYRHINPAYFQACDRKLAHLVEAGIVPCIVGGWGYHALFMGPERAVAHWRYLVARYAAWPVIWCLAGEAAMPYYLSKDLAGDSARLRTVWPEVAKVVRDCDPWRRLVTLHPRRHSWEDTEAPEDLDFHMVQAGHMPYAPRIAVEALSAGRERYPDLPIVDAEPPYEGHGGTNGPDVQRYSFWSGMLSGAAGYTYGAAGIYQANDRDQPTGDRPDGGAYDSVTWDEALRFPGAEQIAAGHRLLRSLDFGRARPHPEWVRLDLRWGQDAYPIPVRPFAAGVPGELRLIYLPLRWYHWDGPLVRALEPGARYAASYIDTETMRRRELGVISGDASGEWRAPTLSTMHDWLLLLERA